MKSKVLMFAGALMSLVFWTSCNQSSTGGGGSGDKVQMEVKVTPGMVYKQVTKTAQTSEQKVMGMSTKTNQTTEIFLKNEVVSVSGEGVAQIRCTYERVKAEMENSMMGKMSYDSDKDLESANPQFASYKALIGKSIQFDMDKRGTVVAVSGVDSLFESILGSVGGEEGGETMEATKNALKATFGDDAMKSMMQSAAIQYPDVLVAEGDTWGKKISQMGAMPLAMDVTYKVDHIDADKVVLSFEGTITTDKDKALDLGLVQMTMDLHGNYEGTSEIDRKNGLVLKSEVKQKLEGSMSTMGMNVPMSIDQTITVDRY